MSEATSTPLVTLDALMAAMGSAVAKVGPRAVPVPELGGHVFVMPMNTADILLYEDRQPPAAATPEQKKGWEIARLLSDSQGVRIVEPDNLAFLDRVAALPWAASKRIMDAAMAGQGGDPNAG